MRRSREFTNALSPGMWAMLERWAEWRSIEGCPKSPPLPDPQKPGIASTAPRGVSRMEEFHHAWLALDWDYQQYILALIVCKEEPLFKGKKWQNHLAVIGLKPKDFAKLLRAALRSLAKALRRRGLMR